MDLSASENASTVTSFAALGICTQLAEAAAALRWKQPTPIQEQAVPHLLQGMHCNPCPTRPPNLRAGTQVCLTALVLLCREGCDRTGTDRVRKDRRLCLAHPAGANPARSLLCSRPQLLN